VTDFSSHWALNQAHQVNSIHALKNLPDNSIHLILSDIPYGISMDTWDVLHNNNNSALLGQSPAQAKAGAVFKKRGKPINGWSEADREIAKEYYQWCSLWAEDWLRVLKPGASAIVFAGRRLAHRCICALEDAGFNYKDMLAWLRERAAHRAQRLSCVYERRGDEAAALHWQGWRVGNLKPSFEPILWFTKPYKIGGTLADNVLQHGVGAYHQDALLKYIEHPENVLPFGFQKQESGLHPTQKPVRLLQALIELTTQEQHIVLDPFCGSGSTLLAAQICKRQFLGFELSADYVKTAQTRLQQ